MPILYPSETTAVHTRFKKLESIIFLVKVSQDVMLLMDLPTVISLQKGYTQLFVCVCVHVLASIKLHALWQHYIPHSREHQLLYLQPQETQKPTT